MICEAALSLLLTAGRRVWGRQSSAGLSDLQHSLDELCLSAAKPLYPPASHQSLLQALSDLHTNPSFARWLCAHTHMGTFRKRAFLWPFLFENGTAAFTITLLHFCMGL